MSRVSCSTGRASLRFGLAALSCAAFLAASWPAPLYAQTDSGSAASSSGTQQVYTDAQLDALLAPIALYPDQLLTQVLMACTYPLQVVEAERWLQEPGNKNLTGDALSKALEAQNWDPSVKSLVPFPQILSMMNSKLDWMQQVGYAMTTQQADVFSSVQRLRKQAQEAGNLKSTPQQTVSTQGQTIIIEPAQPSVVYVPTYSPTVVYGTWLYPAYPPVYWPPPPGYVAGQALVAGLAFGTGVAISASLWGWAQPNWHGGYVNVNVNRYNNINVNRTQINSNNWHAPPRPQGTYRPPAGPVGAPARTGGMPANGAGRSSVPVPGNIARPPSGMGANPKNPAIGSGSKPMVNSAGKPPAGGGGTRPQAPKAQNNFNAGSRPSGGQWSGGGNAFAGVNQGRAANQYSARGMQSRQFSQGGGYRAGGGGFGRSR